MIVRAIFIYKPYCVVRRTITWSTSLLPVSHETIVRASYKTQHRHQSLQRLWYVCLVRSLISNFEGYYDFVNIVSRKGVSSTFNIINLLPTTIRISTFPVLTMADFNKEEKHAAGYKFVVVFFPTEKLTELVPLSWIIKIKGQYFCYYPPQEEYNKVDKWTRLCIEPKKNGNRFSLRYSRVHVSFTYNICILYTNEPFLFLTFLTYFNKYGQIFF